LIISTKFYSEWSGFNHRCLRVCRAYWHNTLAILKLTLINHVLSYFKFKSNKYSDTVNRIFNDLAWYYWISSMHIKMNIISITDNRIIISLYASKTCTESAWNRQTLFCPKMLYFFQNQILKTSSNTSTHLAKPICETLLVSKWFLRKMSFSHRFEKVTLFVKTGTYILLIAFINMMIYGLILYFLESFIRYAWSYKCPCCSGQDHFKMRVRHWVKFGSSFWQVIFWLKICFWTSKILMHPQNYIYILQIPWNIT
jgi:hypothetical protein